MLASAEQNNNTIVTGLSQESAAHDGPSPSAITEHEEPVYVCSTEDNANGETMTNINSAEYVAIESQPTSNVTVGDTSAIPILQVHTQQLPSIIYPSVSIMPTTGVEESVTMQPKKFTPIELTLTLEQLLSRDAMLNQRDMYITNLLTFSASPDLTIPAISLLGHPALSLMTVEEILSAAEQSSILTVDKVRGVITPELKSKRNTLILRETNPSTTPKDILKLLSKCPELTVDAALIDELEDNQEQQQHQLESEQFLSRCCPALISIMLRLDSWFLTFKEEITAANIAWWLRDQELLGVPVQVRIKTEAALRLDLIPSMTSPPRVRGRPFRRWRGSTQPYSKQLPSTLTNDGWTSATTPQSNAVICAHCQKTILNRNSGLVVIPPAGSPNPYCTCNHYNGDYNHSAMTNDRRAYWNRRSGRRAGQSDGFRRSGATNRGADRGGKRHRGGHRCNNDHSNTARTAATGDTIGINNYVAVSTHQEKRIVVVTPSEFPPLCDAVNVGLNCGYPCTDFRQHTMQAIRTICESLPPSVIETPPSGVTAILDTEKDQYGGCYAGGLSAIFKEKPSQHQWCFDTLSQRTTANHSTTTAQRVKRMANKVKQHPPTVAAVTTNTASVTSRNLNDCHSSGDKEETIDTMNSNSNGSGYNGGSSTPASEFWAKQRRSAVRTNVTQDGKKNTSSSLLMSEGELDAMKVQQKAASCWSQGTQHLRVTQSSGPKATEIIDNKSPMTHSSNAPTKIIVGNDTDNDDAANKLNLVMFGSLNSDEHSKNSVTIETEAGIVSTMLNYSSKE